MPKEEQIKRSFCANYLWAATLLLISAVDRQPIALAEDKTGQRPDAESATVRPAVTANRVPVADIGKSTVILGRLRRPIGEEVTIGGYKFTNGPFRDCFRVETVDGHQLDPSTTVNIAGIVDWPDKTTATIRGYEVGTIRFLQLNDTNYGPDGAGYSPHQTIFLHFKPLEIVAPPSLKFREEKRIRTD